MSQVVFKDLIFDIGKRLFYCGGLGYDVNTVFVIFNHVLKSANLTFDDLQSPDKFLLGSIHIPIVYPLGGISKN